MAQSTFDSTKESFHDLLTEAGGGKLQLPDFQRGWVWDDYGIRSLLASISQGFPIGALMMLKTGGEVQFQAHPIEGVPAETVRHDPERLVLDGQQRLTSMFQACCRNQAVETLNDKRRKVRRWYYIDMQEALDPATDREEAIRSLPLERKITRDFGRTTVLDCSTPEKEYENFLFPARLIFSPDEWENGYMEYWDYDKQYIKFFKAFNNQVLDVFKTYHVPVIALHKETSKEAVCLVFEKVNTGGKKLDAFELLTAMYAADGYKLRDDWLGNEHKKIEGRVERLGRYNVLSNLASTDFLQAITLLHTHDLHEEAKKKGITNPKEIPAVSCHRRALLNLPLEAYQKYADKVEHAFKRAAKFLTLQKVFWYKDVPYPTQAVPLAAILVRLGDKWHHQGVRERLAQWYWCGVFGELYGSTTETRFARDFQQVPAWLEGGDLPATITEAYFTPERLHTLRSRNAAAYKGVNALLKLKGGHDLMSGQPIEYGSFWEENIDIHHLFPKDWCKKNGLDSKFYDSIVNKTPLSARTNRIIGGRAPSTYLPRLEKEAGMSPEKLDELLRSHAIDPDSMRRDDFQTFFQTRTEALLKMIEAVVGKPIHRTDTDIEEGEEPDDQGEMAEEVQDTMEYQDPEEEMLA